MSTFITRLDDDGGSGPRVAVKDLIDVAGVPTTAGSRAVERVAQAAEKDAACLAGVRSAGARLVGKTNLHELAMLPFGTNPWFGTPTNPFDPALIPGGSSSGSAVAVATDEADVALGSDTGGSIRIPAACCGVSGLKTTHGRIPLDGVWPLAPSFDTVGPLSRKVSGLILGMQLLEPGFSPSSQPSSTVGRLRTDAQPEIEAAVDGALSRAGLNVVSVDWSEWDSGAALWSTIFFAELWEADHHIIESDPEGVGADIAEMLGLGEMLKSGLAEAQAQVDQWRHSLSALFDQAELLVLPTLPVFPYRTDDLDDFAPKAIEITRYTAIFNLAGSPCSAQPIPVPGSPLPASLQLVGPLGGEAEILATAKLIEDAVLP